MTVPFLLSRFMVRSDAGLKACSTVLLASDAGLKARSTKGPLYRALPRGQADLVDPLFVVGHDAVAVELQRDGEVVARLRQCVRVLVDVVLGAVDGDRDEVDAAVGGALGLGGEVVPGVGS